MVWKLSEDHLSYEYWADLMSYQRKFSPHKACHKCIFSNSRLPKNCHPALTISPQASSPLPPSLYPLPTPSTSHPQIPTSYQLTKVSLWFSLIQHHTTMLLSPYCNWWCCRSGTRWSFCLGYVHCGGWYEAWDSSRWFKRLYIFSRWCSMQWRQQLGCCRAKLLSLVRSSCLAKCTGCLTLVEPTARRGLNRRAADGQVGGTVTKRSYICIHHRHSQ